MRENMRAIDVDKLIRLIQSLNGNPAGPRNATQLERALGLSHNCISNAKRRGNVNADDLRRLESFFNSSIEKLPDTVATDMSHIGDSITTGTMVDDDVITLLQIAAENNELLKELTGLFLGGKDYGAD